MEVIKEPGRSGRGIGALPVWVKDIIYGEVVANTPHGQSIRMTRHNAIGKDEYLCFEDNTRMLRLMLRQRPDDVFEMHGFSMDKPKPNHPARPPWTQSKAWSKIFDQPALHAVEMMKQEFVEFFARHPSHYPLRDTEKIKVTDDLRALKSNKHWKEQRPTFFCGMVKAGHEQEDGAYTVQVEGTRDGEKVCVDLTLEKGHYYGKRPKPGDWFITKQNYLAVVTSDRELERYYTYVPYSIHG